MIARVVSRSGLCSASAINCGSRVVSSALLPAGSDTVRTQARRQALRSSRGSRASTRAISCRWVSSPE